MFVFKMEKVYTIIKDLGTVPCGVKTVETFKIENNTKKTQILEIRQKNSKTLNDSDLLKSRLHIHPIQAVVQPKQIICFKLSYCSYVDEVTENFYYNIFDGENLAGTLTVHAKSVGPCLHPTTFNLRFFRFHDVNQTVKNIEIVNTVKQDARFYFDIDEDSQDLQISQTRGIIPGGLKLGLKIKFNPPEPGLYYKRIFCIVQFHKPLIFNILAVYKPKLKLEPKKLTFKFPPEIEHSDSFEAYLYKEDTSRLPEADKPLQRCFEDLDLSDVTNTEGSDYERTYWTLLPESPIKPECKHLTGEVFLTTQFIDVKNSPKVLRATSLVNLSKCQLYYYEWNNDPEENFQMSPYKGFLKANTKIDFAIYFTPSTLDSLYHIDFYLKIFLCDEETENELSHIIRLPLTTRLRIIGHSFPDDSCGWIPQCKVTPNLLHMRTCVPDENVYATFIMERTGHLPVSFRMTYSNNHHFTAHPPLGYLSGNYQLFVVHFNSTGKDPGIYTENIKIKFNNSDANTETLKLLINVEIPRLLFGKDNTVTFEPIFPGSRVSARVTIENPTNLPLRYNFIIPESMNWIEIANETGLIEPKGFGEFTVVFKPIDPCEYSDYIPCCISSIHKPDQPEVVHLQVIGSCQYGYLVATPSRYDFGDSLYKETKTVQISLYNFSFTSLYFRLKVVSSSFPPGDPDTDVEIFPSKGKVPVKGSFKVEVKITPNNIGDFQYTIQCQNFESESDEAKPCEDPRNIFLMKYEGVLPYMQIIDLYSHDAGKLFSSHNLWKMLRIEKVNEALKSLNSRSVIKVRIPEAVRNSPPITLAFLVESSKYGKLKWNVNLEVQCPCYEASTKNLLNECLHVKAIFVRPTKYVTAPFEKSLLLIKINYEFFTECMIVMTINLPHKRKVLLKMPLLSLSGEPPTSLSTYLNPVFNLKPVFIGDPHPPVQLFWLYNNTNHAASYFLDMETLQVGSHKKIFDCINPEGDIEPYSPYPLGIVFKPTEMIKYSVDVHLNLNSLSNFIIRITGEGVLQMEPLKDTAIPKTIPMVPSLNDDLQCCENFVNIPLVGLHSRTTHIFFIKNSSKCDIWSYQWSRYSFENIFSVRVHPEKGFLQPDTKAQMTLQLKTYCHPTFISFSIPCEILNMTKLNAYKNWVKVKEMVEERDSQHFTISDKGIKYVSTKMTKVEKPIPLIIFITVNANVVNNYQKDKLLSYKIHYTPPTGKEVHKNSTLNFPLSEPMLKLVQELLEKVLWDILYHPGVVKKVIAAQKSREFIYKQIMPQSLKNKEEFVTLFNSAPRMHMVQNIVESLMHDIVCKNYIPQNIPKTD